MPSSVINQINRKLANRTVPIERRPKASTSASYIDLPVTVDPLVIHGIITSCQQNGFIKRADIVRFVRTLRRGQFNEVIRQINEELRDVYGLEIFEDDKLRGIFYMASILPADPPDENNVLDQFTTGVCYAVLTCIFMVNPVHLRLQEAALWRLLSYLGLCGADCTRCVYFEFDMDLKTLISGRFVREGWLRREPVPDSNPVVYEYAWGARANRVIDKTEMLTFVSSVYGFREGAQAWPEHLLAIPNGSSVSTPENS